VKTSPHPQPLSTRGEGSRYQTDYTFPYSPSPFKKKNFISLQPFCSGKGVYFYLSVKFENYRRLEELEVIFLKSR
jgi:hypothetical protein